MAHSSLFWSRMPMGSWDDVLNTDDAVDGATELRMSVGEHLHCGGEIRRRGLKAEGTEEISKSDVELRCVSCNFTVVVPRKINTYGQLCDYLFTLSGCEPSDD